MEAAGGKNNPQCDLRSGPCVWELRKPLYAAEGLLLVSPQGAPSFKQVTVVMWLVTVIACRGREALAVEKLPEDPPLLHILHQLGDSARDRWTGMLPCTARPNAPCFPAGLTEDEDVQAMLRGSRLLKIRSRTWHKERLYRLQEDGLSVWFQRRIPRAASKHICGCGSGVARDGAVGTAEGASADV